MIDINVANFITVGLISVLFWSVLQLIMAKTGINIPFLTNG